MENKTKGVFRVDLKRKKETNSMDNIKARLEMERLIFRPLTASDFGAVHSWAGNSENTRYIDDPLMQKIRRLDKLLVIAEVKTVFFQK